MIEGTRVLGTNRIADAIPEGYRDDRASFGDPEITLTSRATSVSGKETRESRKNGGNYGRGGHAQPVIPRSASTATTQEASYSAMYAQIPDYR